ncbi:hypothetical protein D083_0864 [Dickeya solani RNS 08.23.3.1.A]|nr:hypothetical protein D083_0864 [Dickeya solani RNS 08.23.3.1.A]
MCGQLHFLKHYFISMAQYTLLAGNRKPPESGIDRKNVT